MEINGLGNHARRSGRKQLTGALEHCLVAPHCSAGLSLRWRVRDFVAIAIDY